MEKESVLDALAKASRGLLFISETEAAVEPFQWSDGAPLADDQLIERAGAEQGTPVEVTTLDRFFRAVSREDKADFDRLAAALRENLKEIRVYKVGETEKTAYVVGKTKDGVWAGVKTMVVET